jgi:hypothetical protein
MKPHVRSTPSPKPRAGTGKKPGPKTVSVKGGKKK